MITIPTTIIDDFLHNPEEVREWGLNLPYEPNNDYIYPGQRTKSLQHIHPIYYSYLMERIFTLFFPLKVDTPRTYYGDIFFHKTIEFEGDGWVHQDDNIFTFIIYLSPEDSKINRGTSFYKLNSFHPYHQSELNDKFIGLRYKHYRDGTLSEKEFYLKKQYENNRFSKILDINDRFNRFNAFSSELFHKNNNLYSSASPDRLTLIGFIYNLPPDSVFPISRSKKLSMY